MTLEEILVSEDNEMMSLHGYPRNLAILLEAVVVMLLEMALLEAVAVILLETGGGGACFFCCLEEIVKRSCTAWLVGIVIFFSAESIYGIRKGWMAW